MNNKQATETFDALTRKDQQDAIAQGFIYIPLPAPVKK